MSLTEIQKIFTRIYDQKSKSTQNINEYKNLIKNITIIELLFATGARVSEICNLKLNDIDLESGSIRVLGKGNKERILQICNQEVTNIISEYISLHIIEINEYANLFNNRLGNRLSEQSVRLMIRKYAESSELNKHVTPHMFRHTFATSLLEEGVDIRYVQHLLGHSSIVTTQIYTHVAINKEREILREKHPRRKFKFSS